MTGGGAVRQDWSARSPRWTGVRSEWLEVGEHPTRVHLLRVDGPEEGIPHLLLHGLGGSAGNWLEVMAALAARGPVVAVDLPGFGRTQPPMPAAARVTANARFVPVLARALGWERTVLAGNSMGGLIATLVAARHPGLVERLVLVNPALPGPRGRIPRIPFGTLLRFAPFAVPGLGRRVMSRAFARASAEQLFQDTLRLVLADTRRPDPVLLDVMLENATLTRELPWRPVGFSAAAESLVKLLLTQSAVLRAVDEVAAPTLLLWGDRDRLVGELVISTIAARRRDWDRHVFRGVGHVPMMEAPDEFLEVVLPWLHGPEAAAV